MFRYGFAALIVLTLAARVVRNLFSSRFGTFTLTYADGPVVTLLPGASILEMSQAYAVPHASVCGGGDGVRPAGSASGRAGSICRRRLPPSGRC